MKLSFTKLSAMKMPFKLIDPRWAKRVALAFGLMVAASAPMRAQFTDEIPNARDRAFYVKDGARLLGVQPDGKVLVLTRLRHDGADAAPYTWEVGRLLPTGARDPVFASALRLHTDSFYGFHPAAVLQVDGKWVLAWNSINGAPSRSRIVRLEANGALDPSFVLDPTLDTNSWFGPLAILPNDLILAHLNDAIVRLGRTGSLDASFLPIRRNGDTLALTLLPDRKILVGGYHGDQILPLARYFPDGKLDATFQPQFDQFAEVHCVIVQPDEKIIVSGNFRSIGGVGRTNLARLHPDGTVDTSFLASVFVDDTPAELALLADGRLIVRAIWEGHDQLLRFESDGRLERVLGFRGDHLAFQPDGQFLANVFAGPALFSIARYNLANIDKPGVMFAEEDPWRPLTIFESGGVLTNRILRLGSTDGSLTVTLTGRDGTAKASENYVGQNRILTFVPSETEKTIEVLIVDDTRPEHDKDFFLLLNSGEDGGTVESQIRVLILEDDPGVFPANPAPAPWDSTVSELVFNARPGESWWLERSTDLKAWSRDGLSGDTDGSSGVRRPWQDANAGLFPIRFYRAVKN